MKLSKSLILLTLMLSTGLANADDMATKIAEKGERFLESLQKEINFTELFSKSNSMYGAGATRTATAVPADIAQKDKQWIDWKKNGGNKEAFITEVLESACSKTVQQLSARKNYITEVFIMDKMGATICASPATSDYDQGDEAKWQEPFLNGKTPFIGKTEKDESTGVTQGQVSYLLKNAGQNIGVITIGLKSK